MNKCLDCGEPAKDDEKFCVKCRWAKRNRKSEKPMARSSAGSKRYRSKAGWITLAAFLFVMFLSSIASSFNSLNSSTSSSSSGQDGEQAQLEATFYDANTIPLFVGATAKSAAVMMRDKFDQQFFTIDNVDTERELSTYFRDNGDLDDLDGLFVCSQSIAPGADVEERGFGYIKIEVSEKCANKIVTFAMGPAAEALGRFVPTALESACYEPNNCDLPNLDGVVAGFTEDGYKSHKTVLVETGVGVMEVELALIDLADDWCESDETETQTIREQALQARNELLPIGSFVRLVLTDGLYGNERFVHRLSTNGTFTDGLPPIFSVNEQLVASGHWIPDDDAGSHEWKSIYSSSQKLKNATWQPSSYTSDDESFISYQKRILRAANLSFTDPNPILATCLKAKEKQILAIYEEEEDDRRRSAAAAKKRASDIEAVWRSVFCSDGGSEDYPQRCKNYNPAVDDKVGAGSGGGSNCTWVNSHTRNGSSVRGHWRCG